jgi:hypothetical protein
MCLLNAVIVGYVIPESSELSHGERRFAFRVLFLVHRVGKLGVSRSRTQKNQFRHTRHKITAVERAIIYFDSSIARARKVAGIAGNRHPQGLTISNLTRTFLKTQSAVGAAVG